ncbi:uncharacterized protein K452DRAFT_234319 [Aplosporella prunicola CBS 121167]|uniref:FAD/NAD(P)-binding domain-containing protein n=1 Tax=Aplosporella prunicola CBS 121167 TaxID=1176127 RepID=A0A6A6B2A1_9PEZI|nr:uncharacterized protein K452DRAFT_234319 [Aplosporella prunicola CBS 121167]KAF2138332.1 hypothetical protein K452DRAFT_234319 [Aplosporella prunicola CBS 121167]
MAFSETEGAAAEQNGHASLEPPHRVVVVGGAYAGMAAVLGLLDGIDGGRGRRPRRRVEITLLDERDGFFHSVGSPLAHVARAAVQGSWLPHRDIARLQRKEVRILHGAIKRVTPSTRTIAYIDNDNDGQEARLEYDYLVLATGLKRAWPIVPRATAFKDYVLDANKHIAGIATAANATVVVVGGGAVGIEFAAEIKQHHPHNRVVLIHSRQSLLSNEPLPQEFKDRAAQLLRAEGVELVLGQRATMAKSADGVTATSTTVTLTDGRSIVAGAVFDAVSRFTPNTSFLPREAVDAEGYVFVDERMALTSSPRHFAAGDICHWSGIKRAGPALVMGQVAASNIVAGMLNDEDPSAAPPAPSTFPHVAPMMGLAVGAQAVTFHPDQGVLWGREKLEDVFGEDLGWGSKCACLLLFVCLW